MTTYSATSGEVSNGITLSNGDFLYVSSGGYAAFTTVLDGGTEVMLPGGTASFTTISAGGADIVSGGTAYSTTVSNGGMEIVTSDGTAGFTTVSDGGSQTVSGGTARSAVIGNGGTQRVLADGRTSRTTVNNGGFQRISSGGSANFTTAFDGGVQLISAGGSALATVALIGGGEIVLSGGTANSTTAIRGFVAVSSGGTAIDPMLDLGGSAFVYAGGTASFTAVSSGGEAVVDGGTAMFTTVSSAGDLIVSSGTASDTTVIYRGSETVAGGTAISTTLSSGCIEIDDGGESVSTTVNGAAVEFVSRGGESISAVVLSGGAKFVYSGATVIGATVLSGGTLVVLPGATQTGTVLHSGTTIETGVLWVVGSTIIEATSVISGAGVDGSDDTLYVLPGGTALAAIVTDGGTERVYSGGVASFTTVSSGGTEVVQSFGNATDTVVNVSGAIDVPYLSYTGGGSANVDSTGLLTVSVGGHSYTQQLAGNYAAVHFQVSADAGTGTLITVEAGATGSGISSGGGVTVTDGQFVYLYSGQTATDTTVDAGGYEGVFGGTASFTTLSSGGYQDVNSGGMAIGTTVSRGGQEALGNSGGTSISTSLTGGGIEAIYNSDDWSSDTVVSSATAEFVYSGGKASFTTVSSGGYLVILPGGQQTGTMLSGGAIVSTGIVLYQASSGISAYGDLASNIVVGAGTTDYILSRRSAISATVTNGGADQVDSGGTASFTTLDDSIETVSSGGTTTGTTVHSGGVESLMPGGTAIFLTISNGGFCIGGGTIISATVSNGARWYMGLADATASFTTIDSGGSAVMAGESTAVDTTVNSGGYEVLTGGVAISTTVNLGGAIDLTTLPYFTGGSASVNPNDMLTVSVGGQNYSQQLAGDYADDQFQLAPDPGTGTLITAEDAGETASSIVVGDGDFLNVSPGRTVNGTVVISGGTEFVLSGATTNDTTLDGGVLSVAEGAWAVSTTVNSGGAVSAEFFPYSSGFYDTHLTRVDSTVVNDGGFLVLYGNGADGTASNTTLNSGGTEIVSASGLDGNISMHVGASIDLAYMPYTSGGSGWIVSSVPPLEDGALFVSVGGQSYVQSLEGNFAGTYLQLSKDANGDTLVSLQADAAGGFRDPAPCYRSGTRILTAHGEVAVEVLRVDDLVQTVLGGAMAPIIWVGQREVDCVGHPQPRKVWPVRVAAGAFGPGRPHTALFLSPDHAVYVEGVLIPIRHLINGSTIVQVPVQRVTYCHLELSQHDVVLAEGLPAETFLDMRDGSSYANRSGPMRQYPDVSARMWEAFGCAPLIVTGPELAAARGLIARYAVVLAAA